MLCELNVELIMIKKVASVFMCLFTSQSTATVCLAQSYFQDGVVKMPSFSSLSGEVRVIYVKGDARVEAGSSLLVVETTEATFEVPSPCAGVVKRVLTEQDAIVEVGTPLVELDCT